MFKGSYQKKLLTVLYSGGSNPLDIWDIKVRNGWTRRIKDEHMGNIVFEVAGTNVATAYIVSPRDPRGSLGISLPFITMVIKNLKRYFSFEIQILDDKQMRRRFRFSNYQSATKVRPFTCSVPLALKPEWNQLQLNLANFTMRAYGTNYVETQRVQIHANCRVRRIYFSDRLYAEEELPREYRVNLDVRSSKDKVRVPLAEKVASTLKQPVAQEEQPPPEQTVPTEEEPEAQVAETTYKSPSMLNAYKKTAHEISQTDKPLSGTSLHLRTSERSVHEMFEPDKPESYTSIRLRTSERSVHEIIQPDKPVSNASLHLRTSERNVHEMFEPEKPESNTSLRIRISERSVHEMFEPDKPESNTSLRIRTSERSVHEMFEPDKPESDTSLRIRTSERSVHEMIEPDKPESNISLHMRTSERSAHEIIQPDKTLSNTSLHMRKSQESVHEIFQPEKTESIISLQRHQPAAEDEMGGTTKQIEEAAPHEIDQMELEGLTSEDEASPRTRIVTESEYADSEPVSDSDLDELATVGL